MSPDQYIPAHELSGPADAPVVVLGSSLGTDRRMWEAQTRLLERRYRVVRYELRGHGRSNTPQRDVTGTSTADLGNDVLRLMDHLGVAAAHHVGLSIGGMVAMWLAEHHSARVRRLAVVCSSPYLPPAEKWTRRAATVREQGMGAIWEDVVAGWFTRDFDEPERLTSVRAAFLAVDPEGYAQCCEAIARMDLRAGLGRIAGPVLVVAGAQDLATPPAMSEEIVNGVRAGGARADLELVDRAAHLSAVEQPAAVARLLMKHLDADRAGAHDGHGGAP